MLLVTLALKTQLSISQNRMDQITLNKQLDTHLNKDIINTSSPLMWCQASLQYKQKCGD
jgi:hypothetical protein